MNSIKYNIKLNIKVLKSIFDYFNMNENNTIIELHTNREKARENINEYKDKVILVTNESIYLKKLPFGKLYYFLSKNFIPHVIFYKANNINKINDCEVKIEINSFKIGKISFSDKYNINKTKEFLKKYRTINIELIILILIVLGGLLVYFFKMLG